VVLSARVLIECKKCGAPLDVKGTERIVRCSYCGTQTKLQKTRTIAAQTPADWKPPATWTPPAEAPMRSEPLEYRHRRTGGGCSWALLFPVVIIGVSAGVPLYMSGALDALPFFGKVARWDGSSTLECEVNEHLVIEDREADVTNGPVVQVVGPNCHITIRGSRLRGSEIVRGQTNTEVTVEDSTIEASYDAITGDLNAKVRITGNSTIVAGGDAVRGQVGLVLEVRGATLRAGGTAIAGPTNANVRVMQARIEGGQHAMRFDHNAEVQLAGAEIVGPTSYGQNASVQER